MKKIAIFFIILLMATTAGAQQKASRFAVKSGYVEYKLTGNTKGTKTYYFDDYGDKTREHEKSVTETKILGHTDRTETDKIVIVNDGKYWSIDNISGENYQGEVPYFETRKQFLEQMTAAEQKQLADNILHSFGGERQGTEEFLGKTCDKVSVMGSPLLIYKGITLKSETKVMGIEANETATLFKENITIDPAKFTAPTDKKYVNVTDQQQALIGQMGAAMSDYEAYDEADEYDNTTPLDYPFPQFQAAMESFMPEGYMKTMVVTQDGQHVALFINGNSDFLSVVATSMENVGDAEEFSSFETFSHNGRTLRYGDLSEDDMDGKALIIPYKEHDMYIILLSAPGQDRDTMVEMADRLEF